MPRTRGSKNRKTLAKQDTAPEALEKVREEWLRVRKEFLELEGAETPDEKEHRKALTHQLRSLEMEMRKLELLTEEKIEHDRKAEEMRQIRELVGTLVDSGNSAEEIRQHLCNIISKEDK